MNPIIQAVDTLTDAKIKGLKFDKTITGNVIDVVDYNQGIYRAKYESGTFLVYAEDPNMIYQKGDSIYIKIPEGDYSNKKFIEGKIKTGTDTSSIIELSQTLVHSDKIFTENDLNEELFKEYLEIYKNQWLKVSASFSSKVTINNNYGYNFNQGDKFIGKFDAVDMNGSIFTPNGETQSKYIKLLDDVNDITYETIGDEIQGTNLTFQFCAEEDFSAMPYYLTINQLDNDPLKLQGRLFNSGKEIAGLKYQWYCLATDMETAEFDVELGFPWTKIKDQTSSVLEVAAPDGQQTYKLVVEYTTGKKISQDYIVNLAPSSEDGKIIYFDNLDGIIKNKENYPFLKAWKKHGNNLYTFIWKNPSNNKNILIEGQNLFYFDTNSNISADIGDKEYVLTPYYFDDNVIKEINWYITNGIDEDSNTWENKIEKNKVYNPHHSMLKNVWIDVNNNLRYSIKDTYSITNYNNIFRLEYVFSDNTKLYQTQEIFFIKDGQQGTNSSEYCCNIRPVNQSGAYINDEEFAITTNKCLNVETFKNSKLIKREIIKNVSGDTYKAIVKIDSYTLYFHYPIYRYTGTDILTYLEVPKYIQYAASGYSPKWYNRIIKAEKLDKQNIVLVGSKINEIKLVDVENNKLKPITPFKYGSIIGKLTNESKNLTCPIMMYVEYQSNGTIEGWDGTGITTNGEEIKNPQVGVGTETENGFTGLVMSENNGGGLYGYKNGDNTFGLKANGTAYFDTIQIQHKINDPQVEDGNYETVSGNMGMIKGTAYDDNGKQYTTYNVGIKSDSNSIVLETNHNIRLGKQGVTDNIFLYGSSEIGLNTIKVTLPFNTWFGNHQLGGFYNEYQYFITNTYANKITELENKIISLQTQIDNLSKSDK